MPGQMRNDFAFAAHPRALRPVASIGSAEVTDGGRGAGYDPQDRLAAFGAALGGRARRGAFDRERGDRLSGSALRSRRINYVAAALGETQLRAHPPGKPADRLVRFRGMSRGKMEDGLHLR